MKIYTATHPLEAHMLMQLLHQQGIACELRGEMLFALRGEIPMDSSSALHFGYRNRSNKPQRSKSSENFSIPTRRMLAMPRVWGAS